MRRLHTTILALALLIPAGSALAAHSGPQIKQIFEQGVAAYDAGDYEKAFKLWWELQFEDLAAMRNLGMMLRKGQGTAPDPQKAVEILARAAQAGLPTAQADLADMFLKGEAGPPDPKAALPLLAAAAAANHPVAQYQLGQFYETGRDGLVPQNLETARTLYAAAASHGMPEAIAKLKELGPPSGTAAPAAPPIPTTTAAAPAALANPGP
jgi:TPR repeat protein